LDDTRLVEGLKHGKDEAFQELLDRYEGKIFSTVFRIVKDFSYAEDVVQEVFVKTLRNIESFNFQAGLYTWIYRIAVNAALDCRKKNRQLRAVPLHLDEEQTLQIPADEHDPSEGPEQKEMAGLLAKALDELPEKYRTILILREFDGLSYEDISKVLDCSKGTVESRLFRARERLRKKMERYL
jgi:RNA polymerase sigma-70 factor (ECF subfamily)